MSKISRRTFTGLMTASTAALAMPSISLGALPRVVVIGGGAGGGIRLGRGKGGHDQPRGEPLQRGGGGGGGGGR